MIENYNLDSKSLKHSEVLESNSEEINYTQAGLSNNFNEETNDDNDFKNKSENNYKEIIEEENQADVQTLQVDSNDNFNEQLSDDDYFQEDYNEDGYLENQTEYENQEDKNQHIGFVEFPGMLKDRKNRIQDNLKILDNERKSLNKYIAKLIDIIDVEADPERKYSHQEKKKACEEKKFFIEEGMDKKEDQLKNINRQLKLYDAPKRQKFYNEQLKVAENISPEIFSNTNREPIEDTLYYAVTFFQRLSPYDFKRVVSWLLEGRKTTIQVKFQVTTEEGEIKSFEQSQEKLMTEIWYEICKNPDQILLNCGICAVTLEDSSQVIDFFAPELREKFKDYFKHKQPFYLLEQYKKSRFLLFDREDKVAENAVYLFVEMFTISPKTFGINWLFEIIEIINNGELEKLELLKDIKPEKREKFIRNRFSSLLSEMLGYEKLLNIFEIFLNGLINRKEHSTVLQITEILFSYSNFNGLKWFKQILERCEDNEKEKAYKSLRQYCCQNNWYAFELLKEIKNWLPKSHQKNYSRSNEYALRLFPDYCYHTIEKIETNYYDSITFQYSLLKGLDIDDFKKKVNLLFTWLFHPKTALENENFEKWFEIFEVEHDFPLEYFHPLLLTKWCIILWGVDNKGGELEVFQREMIDTLIQQVVVYPASSQKEYKKRKEKFVQCWRRLAQDLLNKAVKSGKLGESNQKKKYIHRRNIVKYLNKQFNLQIKKRNLIKE